MHPPLQTEREALNAAIAATLDHTTDALPTLSGHIVQVTANQRHHRTDASAVVYLVVPTGNPCTARCLPLDAPIARRLAANLLDCAAMVDRHNSATPVEPDQAGLDAAISDMVGLASC